MQKKPPNAFVTPCLSSPLVILLIFPPQYLICPFSIACVISMLIYQCLFDFCCSLYVFYKFQSKLVRVDLPLIGNQEKGCGLWEVVFQNLGDGEGKDNHEVTYDSGYSKSDECQHANDLQVIRQHDISHTVQPYTLSCFSIEKNPLLG